MIQQASRAALLSHRPATIPPPTDTHPPLSEEPAAAQPHTIQQQQLQQQQAQQQQQRLQPKAPRPTPSALTLKHLHPHHQSFSESGAGSRSPSTHFAAAAAAAPQPTPSPRADSPSWTESIMSFLFKRKEDGSMPSPSPTQSPTLPQAVPLHPQVSHGASATRSDQQHEHSRADSPSTARMPTFHTGSYNSCSNSAAGSLASSFVGGAASGLRVHAQGSSQPGTPPNELAVTRQSSVSSTSSNVAPHVPHSNPLIMATNRGPSGSVHHIYSTNVSLTPSSSLPSTPIHQSYMGSVPNISNELSFAAPPSGPLPAFPASLPLHPTAGMRASPTPNMSTPPNMPLPVLHMSDSSVVAAADMPDASNAPSDEVTAIRRMFSALPSLSRSIFDLGATLGTGTFGRVRIVTYVPHASQASLPVHVTPGQPMYMALKMLKKSEIIRLKQVEHIKAEKSILSRIAHPFIVNLYAAFQDERNLYMVRLTCRLPAAA